MKPLDLRLYAVLDPARLRNRDPVTCAVAAARGGATLLQLRDKTSGARPLVTLARDLTAALAPFGVPLIVNDRVDVALAANAAGVHLGKDDMEPVDARRLLGDGAILGVTIHHGHEAAALAPGLADYAGLGPVFPTATKDPGDPPLEPAGLARLRAAVRAHHRALPACAIAGIDLTNAASVLAAGVAGIAVVTALFMAEDIEAAAGALRELIDRSPYAPPGAVA